MRALILNDRPWHYECYIHILDFCLTHNIFVEIMEMKPDWVGMKDFYETQFSSHVKYIKHVLFNKDRDFLDRSRKPYDLIFMPTDFPCMENYLPHIKKGSDLDKKIIFIDHAPEIRNHLSNHVDIRYFTNQKQHAYTCINLVDLNQKKLALSKENNLNIFFCANQENIDKEKEISRMLSFGKNVHIYWATKNPGFKGSEEYNSQQITFLKSCTQKELHDTLLKCHYVYVPNYTHRDYKNTATTGILGSAFSFLCQTIFPDRNYNQSYKLYSPIEWSSNIELNHNPNIELVEKERAELINHRNKVFSSFLPKLKHKLYTTTLNYNQPELTDNIYNQLSKPHQKCNIDIEILDNGSTKEKAKSTTLSLSENLFFGGGVDVLLKKFLESDNEYFAVINNDILFHGDRFFDSLIDEMVEHDLSLHSPSVINSTINQCSWSQMWNWHTKTVRTVDFIDWMFPVMRRDLAELIVEFPKELHLGWGLDFYSGIIAQKNNLKVGVSDNITVNHLVSNTFKSGNIEITENKFSTDAKNNMNKYFLNSKYKNQFLQMRQNNFVGHYKP